MARRYCVMLYPAHTYRRLTAFKRPRVPPGSESAEATGQQSCTACRRTHWRDATRHLPNWRPRCACRECTPQAGLPGPHSTREKPRHDRRMTAAASHLRRAAGGLRAPSRRFPHAVVRGEVMMKQMRLSSSIFRPTLKTCVGASKARSRRADPAYYVYSPFDAAGTTVASIQL